MSVLVKGMKMPENCRSCPFSSVGVDWYYCYCPGVDGKAYDFAQSEAVPDDCLLVALPDKHGRLIDADALIEDVDGDLTDSIAEGRAIEKIMEAKTVIEAEDSE